MPPTCVQILLLLSVFPSATHAYVASDPNNEWIPKGPEDSRSPCPVLNTLANHGYIYRNGTDVPTDLIKNQAEKVFSLSADFLELVFGAVESVDIKFGELPDGTRTLTLSELFPHNKGEHDASFTRRDEYFEPQAQMNAELLNGFLSVNPTNDDLMLEDVAAYHTIRINDSRMNTPDYVPLEDTSVADRIFQCGGEATMIMIAMSQSDSLDRVSKAFLREWFTFERLPEGYLSRQERGLEAVDLMTDFSTEVLGFFMNNMKETLETPLEMVPTPDTLSPTASPEGSSPAFMKLPAEHMIIVAQLIIGIFKTLI